MGRPTLVASSWNNLKAFAADKLGGLYVVTAQGELVYHAIRTPGTGAPHFMAPQKLVSDWGDYKAIFISNNYTNAGPILR